MSRLFNGMGILIQTTSSPLCELSSERLQQRSIPTWPAIAAPPFAPPVLNPETGRDAPSHTASQCRSKPRDFSLKPIWSRSELDSPLIKEENKRRTHLVPLEGSGC